VKPGPYWLDRKYELVRRVVWELADGDEAAFWREEELIFALRPPFNGHPDARVPYIVMAETSAGVLSLALEVGSPSTRRSYGCFPHLGKGKGSRLGVVCSDGYTALLRLLWAAAGDGVHVPAGITRAAPLSFSVAVPADVPESLHLFLSGRRARLASELLDAASHRPAYMRPALERDKEAALGFFAAGPALVRTRRLRHGVRARVLDAETYRRLVCAEIAPVIGS
jgi:hypothetical protein